MGVSPYSYVLDLIRKGFPQATSYGVLAGRFFYESATNLMRSWVGGWAGKFLGDSLRNNPSSSLGDYLPTNPIGDWPPRVDDAPAVIQSWFSETVDPPYDIAINSKTSIEDVVTYGRWRYRATDYGTFIMYTESILGTIAKEYKIGDNGKTEFLDQYIIGEPRILP